MCFCFVVVLCCFLLWCCFCCCCCCPCCCCLRLAPRVASASMDEADFAGAEAGEIWPSATLRYFVAHAKVDSQDKDAYFEALTAAFGAMLDSVPRSWSQLKLAYHKVINSHPSKNQIETDKHEAASAKNNARRLLRRRRRSSGLSQGHHRLPNLREAASAKALHGDGVPDRLQGRAVRGR